MQRQPGLRLRSIPALRGSKGDIPPPASSLSSGGGPLGGTCPAGGHWRSGLARSLLKTTGRPHDSLAERSYVGPTRPRHTADVDPELTESYRACEPSRLPTERFHEKRQQNRQLQEVDYALVGAGLVPRPTQAPHLGWDASDPSQ